MTWYRAMFGNPKGSAVPQQEVFELPDGVDCLNEAYKRMPPGFHFLSVTPIQPESATGMDKGVILMSELKKDVLRIMNEE